MKPVHNPFLQVAIAERLNAGIAFQERKAGGRCLGRDANALLMAGELVEVVRI